MNAALAQRLDDYAAAYAARERAWQPHDRRGRWVVMEPGPGRLLKGSPRAVRRYVDAITPRRARRFSSLSQARAFARSVDGFVARWQRTPPGGGVWKSQGPWERVLTMGPVGPWLPVMGQPLAEEPT